MMCPRCRREYDAENDSTCPDCGGPMPSSGILKTSTILIAGGRTDAAYRSLDEVPQPLRKQLLKSTTGLNSATILIADQRGREELVKAIGRLSPSKPERRIRACRLPARLAAAIAFLAIFLALIRRWLPAAR